MITLAIALSLTVQGGTASAPADGMTLAKRVTAAIKGATDFQDVDFVRPLSSTSKAALRKFASCKVDEIEHWLKADPGEPDTYVTDPDNVLVRYNCKGVPSATPAGLSLRLREGKIATIEMHNADLVTGR